ncbi:hypothetical protein GCM10011515_21050 [Tsuneonella deserti]|uniref:Lipoprotein n=1 Tax=Tsuneonella deserti TaxID=2035528 RepID=A0ABQ1SCN1_9SPHN|nr:hypothetical protein [Tsuneonella deserti]GGE01066.1 hypothetical protein GCM10011515_21050 [Tsuneonella deserti]
MRSAALTTVLLLFALSGCDGEKKDAAGERKSAAGQVLGGSISDDMLPLATVQSQNPPASGDASRDEKGASSGTPVRDRKDEARPASSRAAAGAAAEPGAAVPAEATE